MSGETNDKLAVRQETARQEQTQAVALKGAYEPQSMAEGYQLATYLAKSGMLGKDVKSAEQALTVMVAGRELGFTAMQSLRAIYIVEGRVTLSADAMVALVLRSPECEYLEMVESTPMVCTYRTKRRGQKEVVMSFNDADVKTAGLGSVHKTYPATMKRHRCASNICKAVYPDVTLGMLTPDEAREVVEAPSRPIIDAEFTPVEVVESPEARGERWTAAINNAKSEAEAKPTIDEIMKACPDKDSAERKALRTLVQQRKADGWVVLPPHDEVTGEVTGRVPGEDDA